MTDYELKGHKCERIGEAWNAGPDGREFWVGKLLEPIEGYPHETHCLHITTPLKKVVFGFMEADFCQLIALSEIAIGFRVNPTWLDSQVNVYQDLKKVDRLKKQNIFKND